MIGFLRGTVGYKTDSTLIVMVGGVGYKVEAVTALLLLPEGSDIVTYIYTHVREDAIKLFGFSSEQELRMFEMLLTVSGVGPKGAMNIVSILGTQGVSEAVINQDPKIFKHVPGIGTKNAQKIIIELKSKIKGNIGGEVQSSNISYQIKQELESALQSLGYSVGEIRSVVSEVKESENLSEMVRDALRLLNK